jgi:hypothetical protein
MNLSREKIRFSKPLGFKIVRLVPLRRVLVEVFPDVDAQGGALQVESS